jgi:hypothetical protein
MSLERRNNMPVGPAQCCVRFGSNGDLLYERLRSTVYASPRKRAISLTRSLPVGLSVWSRRDTN